jgi:hypothetical protein
MNELKNDILNCKNWKDVDRKILNGAGRLEVRRRGAEGLELELLCE